MEYPNELPEKPEGWTRHLLMHMNFGEDGGAATYRIESKTQTARRQPSATSTKPARAG